MHWKLISLAVLMWGGWTQTGLAQTESSQSGQNPQVSPAKSDEDDTENDEDASGEQGSQGAGTKGATDQPSSPGAPASEPPQTKGESAKVTAPTPRKSRFGLMMGLGFGAGTGSSYSSDYIGASLQVTYKIDKVKILPSDEGTFATFRYLSSTGVTTDSSDVSVSVQHYMIGAEIPYRLARQTLMFSGFNVGAAMRRGFIQGSSYFQKTRWGLAAGIHTRVERTVLSKLALYGGLTAILGKYGWYGADFGIGAKI